MPSACQDGGDTAWVSSARRMGASVFSFVALRGSWTAACQCHGFSLLEGAGQSLLLFLELLYVSVERQEGLLPASLRVQVRREPPPRLVQHFPHHAMMLGS